jgi:cell wall-associated NlpC family hydrolase
MTPPRSRLLVAGAAGLAVALTMATAFLMLLTTVLIGGLANGCGGDGGPGGGARQIGPRSWSAEQTANAQLITSVVVSRTLPRRAAVIAVSTAIVESTLRNLPHGDRDSLGLFQQRPSQGWGTPERILTPSLATATFLDRLVAIPGWATMAPGTAAQAVQRSAFPDAYAPQETPAAALVEQFWTGPDNPLPLAPGAPPVQLASLALTGCPDQGGSNIPLGPGQRNAKAMPPGYQLPADPAARAAVGYAIAQLGKPYVWGATGPGAFDCSGLMQAAWANARVGISRSTTTQVNDGTPIVGLGNLAAGDLLFIPGSMGTPARPRHVGIYAGSGLVINAYDSSTGVIVEPLTNWAPKIVAARRVGPGAPRQVPGPTVLAEGPSR